MQTSINGQTVTFEATEGESAVDVIRERARLTGTKLVCGTGVCGACTVLVDGLPMTSCLLPAHHLGGCQVQTVEAHGRTNLHPVQRAFMACDALQCGFCTPGFINEGIAFYECWRGKHGTEPPTREQIAGAMAGHLCRCGAYVGIYEALQKACTGDFDDPDIVVSLRHEALEKVTGEAKYTADVHFENQLEGCLLRSLHPHARIVSLDASKALAIDGVKAFVELLDATRLVRFVGQPIAAIAAVDRRTAEAALRSIEVTYDICPAVIGMEAARKNDAPSVYPESKRKPPRVREVPKLPGTWQNNTRRVLLNITSRKARKARKRLAEAQKGQHPYLVAHTYRNAVQMHTALEPHAYVATWHDAQRLTVYASTQAVRELRQAIAQHFGLEKQNVQVIAEHVGGAFGAKQGLTEEGIAAISLARVSQRAVRVTCDRLEELSFTGYRPGAEVALALLTNEQGEMRSLVATSSGDAGIAIGSDIGMQIGLASPPGPRAISDYDIVNHMPPGKPFRGPSGPQAFWALEQAIDEAAYKLHRDPLELRCCWYGKNALRLKLLDWATALPAWAQRGPVASMSGRFRRGIGVAAATWPFAYNPSTKVEVSATPDGILARCATQDNGSGIRTVMAQAVAEVFALPPGDVLVQIGNSSAPLGPGSFASQVTNSIHGPVHDAAIEVRDHLLEAARTELHLSNVKAVAGGIHHTGGFMPWHELLQQTQPYTAVQERHTERGPLGIPLRLPGGENDPTPGFRLAHALTLVEVEVDTLLGKIRPIHVWAGIAAGKIFVPALARSQVYGAVIQGLGYALYEAREVDLTTGRNLTANLEAYKIPGIGDTPEIEVHFVEEGFEKVRGQGIGLSELATVGVAAAVGNAVFHATGWRPLNTPIRAGDVIEGVRSC